VEPLNCLDVMVDIETTGTSPDRTAILQIAAVKFDPYQKKIDTNFFNRNLWMPPNRFWDEGTRHFWQQQDPRVYEDVTKDPIDPATAMLEFDAWARQSDGPLRFWAKPTSFDFSFVASYFNDYGISNPFSFRNAIDLNSFMQGRANELGRFDIDMPFEGDAHNGIFDCIHQIKMAFAVCTEGFVKP
jgi:DNA polymerase III alpha subunit (gram-positive type)